MQNTLDLQADGLQQKTKLASTAARQEKESEATLGTGSLRLVS